MAWIVLIVSGIMETVWAAALDASHGLSRLRPSVLFVVALVLSMAGLSYAMRAIPIGTSYAIWVGIGAVGTALYGMIFHHEPATAARLLCLALIIGGVVGLKFLH
ncbi:DMT family transporter [Bailinhaonella thermotolerans]|uniref:Ligand-binding protein SH3 n=1 Tax=Bailinhaonella thermotolerans TaxID=1070861 RepID=A0A3A4BCF2_9ACTN|nr:SMR family transporter [Bailinhaonella thermotolerans]RJL36193.1 ligand-binding protein SH3 [Bailinhaonella thermotolerans]